MVLDVDEDAMLMCRCEKLLLVCQGLDRGLSYQDMDPASDGVEGDWEVCSVRREDCDSVTGGEGVYAFFIRF